jgi:protein SCO1/2
MRARLAITASMGALSLLAGALAAAPGTAFAGSPWGADYFPNVPLVNQDGVVVRFYDDLIKGKAVAVNLIYTHCTASCPLETAKMAQVQKLLGDRVGKDIFFYSISIDPKRDTPETLKAYAQRYHVGPGWQFLTGKDEDIKLVAAKLGLSSLTDAANRDGHQPSLMVGNEATGQWMRNSAVDNPRFLAATIGNFLGWKSDHPNPRYAELAVAPAVGKGGYLFQTRCSACHTIGKGDAVGPDLVNLTERRDPAWVTRYLAEPDKMLADGDPIAKKLFAKYRGVRMPNLGLDPDEVAAILQHIDRESRAASAGSKASSTVRTVSPRG